MDQFENRATAEIPESAEPEPVSKAKSGKSPTQEVEAAYEKAFSALNRDLFGEELPLPYRTLRGNKSSDGHVWPDRFENQKGNKFTELAVRPAEKDAEPQDVLGGLTHQMLRLWQQRFGRKKPSRPNYHNREFADKAKEIGLSVSVPGGREGQVTGDRVELAAIPGGAFEKAVARLLRTGWDVPLREVIEASGPEKRGGQRKKLVCPRCEDHVLTTDAEPECGRCRKETGQNYPMVEESEFIAQGESFELSEEQRKERRQARRKTAKTEPEKEWKDE